MCDMTPSLKHNPRCYPVGATKLAGFTIREKWHLRPPNWLCISGINAREGIWNTHRRSKNFHFPVFRDSGDIDSCELSGKYRSQNLAYPSASIPPPEIWKDGKPEFTAVTSSPSRFIRCHRTEYSSTPPWTFCFADEMPRVSSSS